MEHDGCVGCKYELEPEDSKYCLGCKQNAVDKYAPMTNADRIRSMTDEELAYYLCDISKCESGYCPAYDTCMRTEYGTMKKWLQSKAE